MHELDQAQLRRDSDRIAADFDRTDFLCKETRQRLLERLGLITLDADVVLDLGAGTGAATPALREHYPAATVIELDWSEAMLAVDSGSERIRVCADSQYIPLASDSVDIVVSNLMLPGCAEPLEIFAEARRVLRTPGLFLFNTLGPDTLKNLRRAWASVDNAPHVHVFADMHNIGDALVQAGFREPVMDVEHIDISYQNIARLFADLRAGGAVNRLSTRRQSMTPRGLWESMLAAAEQARDPDGAFIAHVELITGQAWTGEAGPGVMMHDGEATFPVSRLRKQGP